MHPLTGEKTLLDWVRNLSDATIEQHRWEWDRYLDLDLDGTDRRNLVLLGNGQRWHNGEYGYRFSEVASRVLKMGLAGMVFETEIVAVVRWKGWKGQVM